MNWRKPIKGDLKKTETEENQYKHSSTLVRLAKWKNQIKDELKKTY